MADDVGTMFLAGDGYESAGSHEPTNLKTELTYNKAQRVLAKEGAARQAVNQLQQIATIIGETNINSLELDLSSWKLLVGSLIQDWQAFRYLVGIGGDTGTGKSSLLNVLISEKADIAPSSQNGACTAAVCSFSYPKVGDGQNSISADVHLKSKNTVDQELTAFFQELSEFKDNAHLEDGPDNVAYGEQDKFDEQLNLIRDWSGLSEQQLREFGDNGVAAHITNHCQNRDELFNCAKPHNGLTIQVTGSSEQEFLKSIKLYVGSAGRNTKPRWPLVEMVEIYVVADILRDGITLVDLPGEMDAMDARSQIARRYYNKLDGLMIVTPGDRATDNRTATELIRQDQVMDMETDGKINDYSLGVIVTKIDQMNWQGFVESEWPTEKLPQKLQMTMETLENNRNEAEQIEQLTEELVGKLSPEHPDYGEASTQLDDAMTRLADIKGEIPHLEAFCLQKCIEARSLDTKRAFQDYFDRVRRNPRAPTALPVFPVSSHAYRRVKKGKCKGAFPDTGSTGIEAVKDWIIKGSLPKREENSDNVINRCQVLFDAIGGWATNEENIAVKLPGTQLPQIESILQQLRSHLEKLSLRISAASTTFSNMTQDIKHMTKKFCQYVYSLQRKCYLHTAENIDSLAQTFVNHVDKFQKGTSGDTLHWSTYAACIRRYGGAFRTYTKPRRMHCWQARTYGLFWGSHVVSWGQSFGQKLLDRAKVFEGHVQRRVNEYLAAVTGLNTLPEEFKIVFRNGAYKIENLVGDHKACIRTAVSRYRAAVKEIRLNSREKIVEHMSEAYLVARNITGKNKKIRQVSTMRDYAERLKGPMLHKVTLEVDTEVSQQRAKMTEELRSHQDNLMTKIAQVESAVAREVCLSGLNSNQTSSSPELKQLKGVIAHSTQEWREFWMTLKFRLHPQEVLYDDDITVSGYEDCDDGSGMGYTSANGEPPRKRKAMRPVNKAPTKAQRHQNPVLDSVADDSLSLASY